MFSNWKAAPLVLAAALMIPMGLAQSQPANPAPAAKAAGASPQSGTRRASWRELRKAERRQVMADMKAMDARLQAKVDAMNRATGPAKESAMAAVLNELAQQRHEMITKMETMGADTMAMSRGMTNSAMRSSSTCPCMQGAQGTKSPVAGVRNEAGKPSS